MYKSLNGYIISHTVLKEIKVTTILVQVYIRDQGHSSTKGCQNQQAKISTIQHQEHFLFIPDILFYQVLGITDCPK